MVKKDFTQTELNSTRNSLTSAQQAPEQKATPSDTYSANQTQIKSKQRIKDHGEVYTNAREVNAMLDLVKFETERIESRFLEPACGTGNFLAEILRRKLVVVEDKYKKSQHEYERNAVTAISSIYGIDILADNVLVCQTRLFDLFNAQYSALYKNNCKDACRASVRTILHHNILHGDALTLHTVGENPHPIVFAEWVAVNGSMLKRRDFVYDHLVKFSTPPPPDDLFSPENIKNTAVKHNTNSNARLQQSDQGDYSFDVTPVKDYPLIHFLEVGLDLGADLAMSLATGLAGDTPC